MNRSFDPAVVLARVRGLDTTATTAPESADDLSLSFPVLPQVLSAEEAPAAFPVDVLPSTVQAFVSAGAKALDVAPELVAAPFLAFAGGTIGRQLRIELKRGYAQYPVLWVATVGGPGTGKSPALDYARSPFDQLQAEAFADYKADLDKWEAESSAVRAGKAEGAPPPRPREQTYYASDATFESLAPMLEASPGLTLCRDELTGWVRSHDQYRSGGDRQSWLSLWSGAPLKVNRRTAATIFVAHPVVTVAGGVQPNLLPDLAAEGHRADGFVDRFLWAYPQPHFPAWTDAEVDPRVIESVVELCRKLRPSPTPEKDPAEVVSLSPAALEAFRDWHDGNQAEIADAQGLAANAFAKLPNQLGRLTLILHVLTNPDRPTMPVSWETIRNAIDLVEWFRSQLGRVLPLLGAVPPPRGAGVVARISRVLSRTPGVWISRSDIASALGGHVPSGQLCAALDRLATDGRVEQRTVSTPGRAREEWRIADEREKTGKVPVDPDRNAAQEREMTGKGGAASPTAPFPVFPRPSSQLHLSNGHRPPAGSGITHCADCGLPRGQSDEPCPNCGATEWRTA